jgi:hypothetical protein
LLRKALRAYLVATYGAKSAIVAEFGFTPKETTLDIAAKANANEKRAATRAAGGTKAIRNQQKTAAIAPAVSAVAPVSAPVSAPVVTAANGIVPKPVATS